MPRGTGCHPDVAARAFLSNDITALERAGVSNAQRTAWAGRETGANAFYYRFPSRFLVVRVELTAAEKWTLRWCKFMQVLPGDDFPMPLGTLAAHFFPGRPGYFLQQPCKTAVALGEKDSKILSMPRPLPGTAQDRVEMPEMGEAPPRMPSRLLGNLQYDAVAAAPAAVPVVAAPAAVPVAAAPASVPVASKRMHGNVGAQVAPKRERVDMVAVLTALAPVVQAGTVDRPALYRELRDSAGNPHDHTRGFLMADDRWRVFSQRWWNLYAAEHPDEARPVLRPVTEELYRRAKRDIAQAAAAYQEQMRKA